MFLSVGALREGGMVLMDSYCRCINLKKEKFSCTK